jgi:ABC-type multidrug transport system fused ATPase/permease subunit
MANTSKHLLLQFYQNHRIAFWRCFLVGVFEALTMPLLSVALAQTLAALLGFRSLRGHLLQPLGWPLGQDAAMWVAMVVGLILLRAALTWSGYFQRARLGEQLTDGLRQVIFAHHLTMHPRQYETGGTGRYLLRFSGDLSAVQRWLSKGVLQLLSDALFIGFGLFVIGWLLPGAVWIIVVSLCLCAAILLLANRRISAFEDKRRGQKSGLLAFVANRLLHVASIQALNREVAERTRFEQKSGSARDAALVFHRHAALSEAVAGSLPHLLLLAVPVVLTQGRDDASISTEIIAAAFLVFSWRAALLRLFKVGLIWKKARLSFQKLDALLALPQMQGADLPDQKTLRGPLMAHGVSITVNGKILHTDLSFTLNKGETVHLNMPSGSGKSLLVKILAGLHPLSVGRITLGEHRLEDLHPKAGRRQLAFVSDKFPLFGKTIGEAIAYSRSKADKTEARSLFAEFQALFPVFQSLSFNQPLYDPVSTLSFAQMRLLLYLRAFLAHKTYLIVDEPFLGLDEPTSLALKTLLQQKQDRLGILMLGSKKN